MTYTVTIVGAGISGLTVAHKLVALKQENDSPIDIVMLEGSDRVGGVIKSEAVDDFVVEHGPDAFLSEKPEINNLLNELGLAAELMPTNEANRQAFIAKTDNLIPLPAGFFMIAPTKWLPFAISPLFSLLGKMRITLEALLPKNTELRDESVASFLQRRFGKELLERAGQPLVGGIYMADISLLSAQSTLPQFVELEKKHGSVIRGLFKTAHTGASSASGARYHLFKTLKTGTQLVIDRIIEKLTDVRVSLNTSLLSVAYGKEKNWLLTTNQGQFETDALVFAIPAKLASLTVKELDPVLSKTLAKIESGNSVVVNLLYKKSDIGKPRKGFGFVIPVIENKNIIAAGFISQKFPHRAKEDYEMIRVFLGGQIAPHLFALNDEQLVQLAHEEITPFLGLKGPAAESWLSRWSCGLPFYQVDHKKVVRSIETLSKNHPGFYFTGSSYNGLGIPDCVRDGEKTAKLLAKSIQQGKLKCLSPTV